MITNSNVEVKVIRKKGIMWETFERVFIKKFIYFVSVLLLLSCDNGLV